MNLAPGLGGQCCLDLVRGDVLDESYVYANFGHLGAKQVVGSTVHLHVVDLC
jgi:hypothetical protein